jgi:hypothetical protein
MYIYICIQVVWYRKNAQLQGAKRNFDMIEYVDESRRVVKQKDARVFHFQPWSTYKREGLADGKSIAQLEASWKALTEGPNCQARFEEGMWLVPCFAGIYASTEDGTEQVSSTARRVP